MLPVMDVGLKTALLATLIDRLDTGDIEALIRLGFPPNDLEGLRKLSATDLTRMASNHRLKINYTVAPWAITVALNSLKVQAIYEVELEAFVTRGASLSMLRQLFRGNTDQVKLYRTMLVPNKQSGRPVMPDSACRDAIHTAWEILAIEHALDTNLILKSNANTRKALLKLHDQFSDLSLETLFAVLNEFDAQKGLL